MTLTSTDKDQKLKVNRLKLHLWDPLSYKQDLKCYFIISLRTYSIPKMFFVFLFFFGFWVLGFLGFFFCLFLLFVFLVSYGRDPSWVSRICNRVHYAIQLLDSSLLLGEPVSWISLKWYVLLDSSLGQSKHHWFFSFTLLLKQTNY